MSEKQPFFSVIMPVYNAEKTLNTSIGSILTQTFSDHEFIIIENGSTDKSLDIAKAYEAAFPKLRVLKSEPKGVSRARNMGLDEARGEYVVFLDADDSYSSNALAVMHDALMRRPIDLLICGFTAYWLPDTGELQPLDPALLHLAMLDPAAYHDICFGCTADSRVDFSLRHQCSRAYKLSFLRENGIRFDERCPVYVDLIFNSKAYRASKTPHCLYRGLYRYNRTNGSLIRRAAEAYLPDAAKAFSVMSEWLETEQGAVRDASVYFLFTVLAAMVISCTRECTESAFEKLKEVLQTEAAQTVIGEIRGDNLHLLPHKNDLFKRLLALLRVGDLRGAISLFKEYGGLR